MSTGTTSEYPPNPCPAYAYVNGSASAPTAGSAKTLTRAQIDERIEAISSRVRPPAIPDREIDLIDFCGHAPDRAGSHDFHGDIAQAIELLGSRGGGTLVLRHPQAEQWAKQTLVYRIKGPIHLRSNIGLELDHAIRLQFEFDPQCYLPDDNGVFLCYEGTAVYSFSPLIYACGVSNVRIAARKGHGAGPVIHGDGERWQQWAEDGQMRQRAQGVLPTYECLKHEVNANKVPICQRHFTDPRQHFLRPTMLGLYLSRNILVEGVTFRESPFWVVHPVFCERARFRDLVFDCYVVNNDGIDPECCRDVVIEHVIFGNHDDNVAVKGGRDAEGREGIDISTEALATIDSTYINDGVLGGPTEDIVVRECTFNGHYGFCVGSDLANTTQRLYAVDNYAPLRVGMGAYIKSSRHRGAVIREVYVDNLRVNEAAHTAICINLNYDNDPDAEFPSLVQDIQITNVNVRRAPRGIVVEGWADRPIRDVILENVIIDETTSCELEAIQTDGLRLRNVQANGKSLDGTYSVIDPGRLPRHTI